MRGVIKAETRNVNIKLKSGDYRKDREIKKAEKKNQENYFLSHEYKSAIKKYLKGTLKWIKTHNRIEDNENFCGWKCLKRKRNKQTNKNKQKTESNVGDDKKTKKWRWIGKNERKELRHSF